MIAGRELANAYSELTDPVDQRERFEAEARAKGGGRPRGRRRRRGLPPRDGAGMPPTGGLGVGVDWLVMLLTGATTIRDVLLFPTLRPEAGDPPRRRAAWSRSRSRSRAPARRPRSPQPFGPQPERLTPPRPSPGQGDAPRRPGRARGGGRVISLLAAPRWSTRLGTGAVLDVEGRAGGSIASVIIDSSRSSWRATARAASAARGGWRSPCCWAPRSSTCSRGRTARRARVRALALALLWFRECSGAGRPAVAVDGAALHPALAGQRAALRGHRPARRAGTRSHPTSPSAASWRRSSAA